MTEEKKPSAPITEIRNVRLEEFERAVYTRNYEAAGAILLDFANKLNAGAMFIGHTLQDDQKPKLYTRLASAIIALFADPRFNMSEAGFRRLATVHQIFNTIFECSVYDHTDHLAALITSTPAEIDPSNFKFGDPQSLAKFILLYSLNSNVEMKFDELYQRAARTVLPVWLGLLGHLIVLHPLAQQRREKLLTMGKYFEDLVLPIENLSSLSDGYMYCSYATSPTRHDVKKSLNTLIRNMLRETFSSDNVVVKPMPAKRVHKQKPTIFMPLEWFSSFHAMYRCYAPSVLQLKERFRLVGSTKKSAMDENALKVFDDFIALPEDTVVLSDIVKRVEKLKPDMVYYPSVGMAFWWIAISNLRLAPIQMLTLGHPATTHSPMMDYVIAEEGQIGDAALFSEKVVWLPPNSIQFTQRIDADDYKVPDFEEYPEVFRIGIPAYIPKVSGPFLDALRRIGEQAGRKLEFHFLTNQISMHEYLVKLQLGRWLGRYGTVVIQPRLNYHEYMAQLARMHVHLCTFPFGGTNSNIDSMLLGIPLICLEGPQPHEKFDALMNRRVGLGELVTQTPEDYVTTALWMITNSTVRRRHRETLLQYDVKREFFAPRTGPAAGAFVRAFWHVYKNHERIQESQTSVGWQDYTEVA